MSTATFSFDPGPMFTRCAQARVMNLTLTCEKVKRDKRRCSRRAAVHVHDGAGVYVGEFCTQHWYQMYDDVLVAKCPGGDS